MVGDAIAGNSGAVSIGCGTCGSRTTASCDRGTVTSSGCGEAMTVGGKFTTGVGSGSANVAAGGSTVGRKPGWTGGGAGAMSCGISTSTATTSASAFQAGTI